jgi:excisionase family DNA binding protein
MTEEKIENLFNVNQAAFILKVHPLTIRRYIRDGRLRAIKVGGNVRIKESQLNEFNRDFTPRIPSMKTNFGDQKIPAKTFTETDPFFQLQGRGAALNL